MEEHRSRNGSEKKYNRRRVGSYWYAAAIILVVCTLAVLFYLLEPQHHQTVKKKQPIHFITGASQQKVFTLSDGTKIRLNSNSQLWISGSYGRGNREVTLKGEAYFEVKHDEAHPFTVHVHGISIKDLGTAFSVRAIPGESNVQVAVKSGKVSILRKQKSPAKNNEAQTTIGLTQGQYAYVNLKANSISISEFEVMNYFSWMNNQLRFTGAKLSEVSKQLSHIYNVTFSYAADSLKEMTFSAQFERETLKKALAVISLTLSIDYQIANDHVVWIAEETKPKILK